ncbi:hypothetical protein MMC14_009898 [Varicellaria rhodocarpa]|nr:hypothetical protein [Varicellaria rhodocarpa]
MGLHYQCFELIEGVTAVENALVITPPSPPNTAASGPTAQIRYGGPPEINTNIASHDITYFDALSLYFACVVNGEAVTTGGIACRVEFASTYYSGGNVIVAQQASFVPSSTSPSKFQQIVFDPRFFRGLKTLTLSIIVDPIPSTTTILLIDSFDYKGCSPS